jgi:hypothetical protein
LSRNPARAKTISIVLSLRSNYTPFPTLMPLTHTLFCSPLPRTDATHHFYHNYVPFCSYSAVPASHLASKVTFFTRLTAQTTRLRLRHLNKPGCRRPFGRLGGFLVVTRGTAVPCCYSWDCRELLDGLFLFLFLVTLCALDKDS